MIAHNQVRNLKMTTRLIESQLHRIINRSYNNGLGRTVRIQSRSTQFLTTYNNHDVGLSTTSSSSYARMIARGLTTATNKKNTTISNHASNSYEETASMSKKTEFKNIPINKSILSYIQTIGVGIRPRRRKKLSSIGKGGKSKSGNENTYRNRFSSNNSYTLPNYDEKAFFDRTAIRGKIRKKSRTTRTTSTTNLDEDEKHPKKESNQMWLPPPPFSTSGTNNKIINDVKRLPVKIIGSVGSLNDEMPRSTKGLPEVAIIGRSNVGKSTLLNALLYGNQETHNRKFVRGKTPEGAKLAKGVKAVVSTKAGETKRITFYQLTSQLSERNGSENNIDNDDHDDHDDHDAKKDQSYKMSLVLVDLPGYGFAYTSEEKANVWKELMNTFLVERGQSLKRILLLIDARHGFKKADYDFLDTLQNLRRQTGDSFDSEDGGKQSYQHRRKKITLPPIQVVLTKSDLVTQNDLARRVVQVRQQLSDALIREPSSLPIMICSAKAGLGYNNVRGEIAKGGILEIQKELAALVPKRGKFS